MFGSIGGTEVILLFVVALLLFGPRRLPEIGRTLGKAISDFRRATNDFKMNLEREVQIEEFKQAVRPIESAPRPETLARGVLLDATPPPSAPAVDPPPGPQSERANPSEDTPAIDGGNGVVH